MKLDYHNDISYSRIANHVRHLRLSGWPQAPITESDIIKVFDDINNFLTDTSSVNKLLFVLPQSREGVGVIAHGLFCDDP